MSKFNFRQVGGARVYRPWKNWEEGDVYIGKFVKEFQDNYGNTSYEFDTIESDFHDGENIEEGKLFGANSAGSLHRKMAEVRPGSVVRIEYAGIDIQDKGPFKGKEFHNILVAVDESTVVSRPVQESVEETESYDL